MNNRSINSFFNGCSAWTFAALSFILPKSWNMKLSTSSMSTATATAAWQTKYTASMALAFAW